MWDIKLNPKRVETPLAIKVHLNHVGYKEKKVIVVYKAGRPGSSEPCGI